MFVYDLCDSVQSIPVEGESDFLDKVATTLGVSKNKLVHSVQIMEDETADEIKADSIRLQYLPSDLRPGSDLADKLVLTNKNIFMKLAEEILDRKLDGGAYFESRQEFFGLRCDVLYISKSKEYPSILIEIQGCADVNLLTRLAKYAILASESHKIDNLVVVVLPVKKLSTGLRDRFSCRTHSPFLRKLPPQCFCKDVFLIDLEETLAAVDLERDCFQKTRMAQLLYILHRGAPAIDALEPFVRNPPFIVEIYETLTSHADQARLRNCQASDALSEIKKLMVDSLHEMLSNEGELRPSVYALLARISAVGLSRPEFEDKRVKKAILGPRAISKSSRFPTRHQYTAKERDFLRKMTNGKKRINWKDVYEAGIDQQIWQEDTVTPNGLRLAYQRLYRGVSSRFSCSIKDH